MADFDADGSEDDPFAAFCGLALGVIAGFAIWFAVIWWALL